MSRFPAPPAALVIALGLAWPLPAAADGAAPAAAAGLDVYTLSGRTIILDGTASSDPEGDTLTFAWAQRDGPAVDLLDATTAHPWFEGIEVGTYTFGLVVDDGLSTSAEDAVEVHLFPDTSHDFYLEQGCGSCATLGAPDRAGAWAWLWVGAGLALSRRRRI